MTDSRFPGNMPSALLTDLYQITMACGYWEHGVASRPAVFSLYFRKCPFQGGFAVAAGLEQALEFLEKFRFSGEDLHYLRSLKTPAGAPLFPRPFLEYLAGLRLQVSVEAVPEGTLVFPFQPLLVVTGPILQCQLLETPLLNMINFQTLVATKAARVCLAARGRPVLEFGLRRAQGIDGSLAAARAAYIGGCAGTSNVLAGKMFDIPVRGTHSHSWVLCFEDELQAFEAFAETFPETAVLLVDTYRTVDGVRHAIETARRLAQQGRRLAGIRLDSGDLLSLARSARRMLDDAGFPEVKILAGSDLDEFSIDALVRAGAPIDAWGVGTRLVTAYGQPALGGVYKLAAVWRRRRWVDTVKISEDPGKINFPGRHTVTRYFQPDGRPLADLLRDVDYPPERGGIGVSPSAPEFRKTVPPGTPFESLSGTVFSNGRRFRPAPPLAEIRERTLRQLESFPESVTALEHPEPYPALVEQSLYQRRERVARARRPC